MVASDSAPIDLIGEFQLRHWARVNYIPADMRGSDLHPVVLDEMRRRDEELSERESASSYSQRNLQND